MPKKNRAYDWSPPEIMMRRAEIPLDACLPFSNAGTQPMKEPANGCILTHSATRSLNGFVLNHPILWSPLQ
jgi:hypothetical protein